MKILELIVIIIHIDKIIDIIIKIEVVVDKD